MVKNLLASAGSISGSGRSLEKEMATHSSILAWKIPWQGSLAGCSPLGHEELGPTEHTYRKLVLYLLLTANMSLLT